MVVPVNAEGAGTSRSEAEKDFSRHVKSSFESLRKNGMDPNEACALALKLAAGMADPLVSVEDVWRSVRIATTVIQAGLGEYEQAALLEEAALGVHRFFSDPQSLYAAFWVDGPRASSRFAGYTAGAVLGGAQAAAGLQLSCAGGAGRADEAEGGGVGKEEGVMNGAGRGECCRHVAGPRGEVVDAVLDRLDMKALKGLYAEIMALRSPRIAYALNSAAEKLVLFIMSNPAVVNPGFLRQITILLLNPLLEDVEFNRLMAAMCNMLVGLQDEQRETVIHLMASLPCQDLRRLVAVVHQYITISLYQQQAITQGIEDATKVMKLLYLANDIAAHSFSQNPALDSNGSGELVSYTEFYNDAVNNEDFNLKEDFRRWKEPFFEFSFCDFPFVYDPASKARILQMENQMAQYNELHNALRDLFSGKPHLDLCPFLVLKVRRGPYLLQDTLIQVNRAKENDSLRKPLKVKFLGEEGVDEGGVQKEFFQLLVRELFNPDYGMFVYDEVLRLHWFRHSHINMETEFEFVGILIGLAIYNSHILEFSFPAVLFKKLTGAKPGFHDLKELYPDVYQNLNKLLTMSEETIAELDLSFTVDTELGFGEIETTDLLANGSSITVTRDNCKQYIELYTQHLLETSIQPQFAAFRKGFLYLCNGEALAWFRPQELELLTCGGQQLDMEALEAATVHDDGYTRSSEVVRWFWEVVHAMSEEQKRRLLFFVTGSDRVPIKGLGHLNPPHVISKMGGDCDRLPTAHTCFNHLLLPPYTSKAMLTQRLLMALEHAEGFGLM